MSSTGYRPYNTNRPIPGVSGNRVPGTVRLPGAPRNGGFRTNVPFQMGSGGQWGSAIFREFHRQQVRDRKGRFGGGWGFAWQGLEAIDANLVDWNNQIHKNLRTRVEQLKDEMVAYMKENAPWEDDPTNDTNAREALQGVVVWEDDEHFTIMLGHGPEIYYGIWLEVRWGGRYAIVLPTIEHFAPQIGGKLATAT